MFCSNLGIVFIIIISRRQRRQLGHGQGQVDKKDRDGGHITKMLLTVSTCSILCLVPYQATVTYYRHFNMTKTAHSKALQSFITAVSTLLMQFNYALNFYAYTLPISKFRRELKALLYRRFCKEFRRVSIPSLILVDARSL
jgi:hypothetical protein